MTAPSKAEEKVLVDFRREIARMELELTDEETTDIRLLAWLRPRDLNVSAAAEMLSKSLQWRKENDIANILEWRPPPNYNQEFYCNIFGNDHDGHPVCVFQVGKWDLRRTTQPGQRNTLCKHIDQLFARAQGQMNESSVKLGREVTQVVAIVDCHHFSNLQLISFGCVETMIELARRFDMHYPEMLFKAYFINSSKLWRIAFGIIRPFFSKRTCDQMELFGHNDNWKEKLLAHISPDQLPKEYGGIL